MKNYNVAKTNTTMILKKMLNVFMLQAIFICFRQLRLQSIYNLRAYFL